MNQGREEGVNETSLRLFLQRGESSMITTLRPDDPVFADSGAKSTGVKAQEERCPVFSLNAPLGFQEYLEDVVLFQIGEGFDLRPEQFRTFTERFKPVQYL